MTADHRPAAADIRFSRDAESGDAILLATVAISGTPPIDGMTPDRIEYRVVVVRDGDDESRSLTARVHGTRDGRRVYTTFSDGGVDDMTGWPAWLVTLSGPLLAMPMTEGSRFSATITTTVDPDDDDPHAELRARYGGGRALLDQLGMIVYGLVVFGGPTWAAWVLSGGNTWLSIFGGVGGGFLLSRLIVVVLNALLARKRRRAATR